MSTTTSTPAIRPGSDELTELLARISVGAEERERELKAPFEPIGWIKEAGSVGCASRSRRAAAAPLCASCSRR